LELKGHYKAFLFTSNQPFKISNPGLCVRTVDASGYPLWGEDPVHPLYGGYDANDVIKVIVLVIAKTFRF
jgi:hypothetical protein